MLLCSGGDLFPLSPLPPQNTCRRESAETSVLAWIRRRDICQDGRVSLDEFVASFQALIPQDTPGWGVASSSVTAAGGKVNTASKRHRTKAFQNLPCGFWYGFPDPLKEGRTAPNSKAGCRHFLKFG